jgi:hypothetical protein
MTALPRPNQAFWTLCALWTGWLWGREAAGPFKSVLRRRRYDWSWHTTALSATLSNLAPLIIPGIPLFGIIAETEPGFLTAVMTAADITGFNLQWAGPDHLAIFGTNIRSNQEPFKTKPGPNSRAISRILFT